MPKLQNSYEEYCYEIIFHVSTFFEQSFNLGTAHTKSVEQSWQELFDTCTKNHLFQLHAYLVYKPHFISNDLETS